ncbi:N-acetyltransferase [Wickerhamomyces ciferrii]|uniref:DNA polymerase eta n=1 Tax=Wickerhamomyces ciferrii (strain ATCC 14091 / BCRC 22168 / CBS 111 / JCM 3599 / NBRC 0793 / NRRL Y-1031 F-60-10) TaxID=1206466 RepID=K0KNK9_WICCF|nr:N-acetyltransferase [Wickerhamomyces ciferrii]CCH46835.1 N-acetyltransferase [Wickerhamomyces ciferrii]
MTDSKITKLTYIQPPHTTHSNFKIKDLLQLNNIDKAYSSPLSVIAHIDVNAFFAQVEQIRLGLSTEDAVVCVQWSSLIAVSYKAREYGITRMDTLENAKLKCPILKAIHTAVFRKGENFWRYHDDDNEFPSPIDHKVSLDPYRRESRKILKIFKSIVDLVEKASVDESFMDLGRLVIKRVFEMIPDLQKQIENLDSDGFLPLIPDGFTLEVTGDVITNEFDSTSLIIKDWDDLLMIIGGQITNEIRLQVQKELGYTLSAGVGRVKTIAKLASGFRKPDNQTIVRNNSINNFLKNFDFTDFWSMGGKTGEFIKMKLSPPLEDSIAFIRNNYDLNELQDYLEDKELASKLYQLIRGEYMQSLSSRIILKSMNSNKNIRFKSVKSLGDSIQWIKVFSADLYQRLIETNDENGYKTRPKTISIHFRSINNFNQPHSKQSSLPLVPIDELESVLFQYGVNLLKLSESQWGKIYPLQNISMTISNFESNEGSGLDGNIMGFVKKGNVDDFFNKEREKGVKEVKVVKEKEKDVKKENKFEISQMFKQKDVNKDNANDKSNKSITKQDNNNNKDEVSNDIISNYEPLSNGLFKCLKCKDQSILDLLEHDDFHYAIELNKKFNGVEDNTKSYGEERLAKRKVNDHGKKSNKKNKFKIDKSQSKLPF